VTNLESATRRGRRGLVAAISAASVAVLAAGIITFNATTGGELAEAEPLAAVAGPSDQHWAAQAWAAETFGTFDAATHHGEGNALIALPEGARAGILTARHTGDGEFTMTMRGAGNQMTGEQPVMTTGDYQGTTVWGVHNATKATALQITADGEWTVTIAPMTGIRALPATGAGVGDGVFLYDGQLRALTATHDGTGRFGVTAFTEDPLATTHLLTQTGPFQGTAFVPTVPAIIAVQSEGAWSLQLH
jgi:hypothetical protein